MKEVFVYETEKFKVIIHEGNLTKEERKAVLENAAKQLWRAIQKQKAIQNAV